MQLKPRIRLLALPMLPLIVSTTLETALGQDPPVTSKCLYAVMVGTKAVASCPAADPDGIGRDEHVRRVIAFFGLDPASISFRGCQDSQYSATHESTTSTDNYRISYPTNRKSPYLAPIVHELAHVYQMKMTKGRDYLTSKYPSINIELSADFLAGVAFSQALKNLSLAEFQHSMSLFGKFYEFDTEAHGTPGQRIAAFRFGAYLPFSRYGYSVERASIHFQDDVYGELQFQK